ncbi:MAG: class I SAM-dependent methyltransferase [Candidatus Melainabacteria bacterium]|nr:class I SAM-dependent methyltransferase [Candidatus Melainabacteria bacterium]
MSTTGLKSDFIQGWRHWSNLHHPADFEASLVSELLAEASGQKEPSSSAFKTKNILEVGCGDGRVLREFAPLSKSVVGVDVNKMLVENLQSELAEALGLLASGNATSSILNVSVDEMSATELQFNDNSFDLVLFPWSLHQIKDKELALKEAKRVLVEGGSLVVFGLMPDGEYENVVAELGLDPGAQVDPVAVYEEPLRKVFGSIAASRRIGRDLDAKRFGFKFASAEEALSAWQWALKNWHEHTADEKQIKLIDERIRRNTHGEEIFMNICGKAYLCTT